MNYKMDQKKNNEKKNNIIFIVKELATKAIMDCRTTDSTQI